MFIFTLSKVFNRACLLAALLVTGCQASNTANEKSTNSANTAVENSSASAASPSAINVTEKGVMAFRDICLKSAPDFATASQLAGPYGITKFNDLLGNQMGMSADKSLGVQIKSSTECVVTTPGKPDSDVRAQFVKVIAEATGSEQSTISKFPFLGTVNGAPFIFHHDRQGGEAYVMIRR